MEEQIKEFIKRRFSEDCGWISGNCYFFAVILQSAFGGKIYYDAIKGHFVVKIENKYYDWTGAIKEVGVLVEWDKFDDYDRFQKERIIRDCIK